MRYWVDLRDKNTDIPLVYPLINGFIINDLSFDSFPSEVNNLIYISAENNILNLERIVTSMLQRYKKNIIIELPYTLDNCNYISKCNLDFCIKVDNFIHMNNALELGSKFVYISNSFSYPEEYRNFVVVDFFNLKEPIPQIVKIKPNEFKEMFL